MVTVLIQVMLCSSNSKILPLAGRMPALQLRRILHQCEPPGWPAVRAESAAAERLAAGAGRALTATETCSWIGCRSLLSSGCAWRYGPVTACDASSALH